MHAVPESRAAIPWHRVINSKGGISTRQILGYVPDLQKSMLVEEGVTFDDRDRCDLSVYQWDGVTKRSGRRTSE